MIEVLSRMRLPITPVLLDEVARLGDIITGEGVNYSLEPVNTGVKWVDGQPVFRRVFIAVSGAAVNTNTAVIHVPGGWGFNGLIRLDGYISTATEDRVPLSFYGGAADYIGVKITLADGDIVERHGGANMNSRPMILIVDYLSVPTGTSSWDGGITAWDSGTSTWDQNTRNAQPLWDGDPSVVWDKR